MPARVRSPRAVFLAIFAVCAALIGFGLWLQHAKGLEPCPLCILQRYAFVVVALVALAGGLHAPRGWGARVYAALVLVAATAGAGVAARQAWLQHFPPAVSECGPDLGFMIGSFPLADALPMIFRGAGDCAKVEWTLLGLSIPEWALAWFALIGLAALALLFGRAGRASQNG